MTAKHLIFGVHVQNRLQKVPSVQKLLSEYGCNIKTRIGLHQVSEELCSHQGLIVLEMFGNEATCQELADKLSALEGVEVQKMVFEHDEE
jgi:hypothetical protein